MLFGVVSRVCGVMYGNGSMVSTGTTVLTMCVMTRPSTQTIPLRTTPPSPLRVQPTGLPVISRRRVLTLAVILMSCSRLPQVAEAKRPMIVTLVGLPLVGASSSTAVFGTMARYVVSLRLVCTMTRPTRTRALGRACFISPPKGVRGIFSPA